jgi:nucleoside-diphosphate-sugar epimerase
LKILITGINGFIGKAVNACLNSMHTVYGISSQFKNKSASVFHLDLSHAHEIEAFILNNKDFKCDVLIHLASYTAQGEASNQSSIIELNAKITEHVIKIAKHIEVKQFINMSSTSVYPNIDGVFSETSEINPSVNSDCYYGLSKWNAEMMLQYQFKNSNIKLLHLRTGMVFGDGMHATRLYPVILNELISENKATLFGLGKRIINYIDAEELARCVEIFIEQQIEGVLNVVTHSQSLIDFTQTIADAYGVSEFEYNLIDKGNAYQFVVSNDKLIQVLQSDV